MKVNPTQCIWTDNDTNKKFLISNKGGPPVSVNVNGQIPSRFTHGVSGFLSFKQRNELSQDSRVSRDFALAH